MKIGILHLTDAHFSSSKDFVCDKVSKIVAAINISMRIVKNIYHFQW